MDKLISQLGIAPASVQIDLDHVMINVADAFPGKQHKPPCQVDHGRSNSFLFQWFDSPEAWHSKWPWCRSQGAAMKVVSL